MILLVRHGVAASRRSWKGADGLRPLTARGMRQATTLPALLAAYPVDRLVSSPAMRCTATLEPLARERALPVETSGSLREGRLERALDLVLDAVEDVALCTHGDVVEGLLDRLRALGWPVPAGQGQTSAKGSTWLLTPRGDCRYLPPPA